MLLVRLPTPERSQLSPQGQECYDEIVGSRGEVRINFKALLNSPDVAARLAHLGTYLRFEGPLPEVLKEVAILAVARETEGHYVWTAHEILARKAGVDEESINSLRRGEVPQGGGAQSAVARYVWALLRDHRVDDNLFEEVWGHLGDQGMVDVTLLMGYYTTMSLSTTALGIETGPKGFSTLGL